MTDGQSSSHNKRLGKRPAEEITIGCSSFSASAPANVQNLFDYLEGGDDLNKFPDDFSSVTREAAISVLDMAKKAVTNQEMLHENFT